MRVRKEAVALSGNSQIEGTTGPEALSGIAPACSRNIKEAGVAGAQQVRGKVEEKDSQR